MAVGTSFRNAKGQNIEALIDDETGAVLYLDHNLHEIHEGNHYFIKTWVLNDGVADTFSEFIFITPNTTTRIHAKVSIASDADSAFEIFEDAEVSANGTAVVGINNNRDSTRVAELLAYSTPTVTDEGNLLWSARSGGGKEKSSVSPQTGYEIIAKTNAIYLFKLTKKTDVDTVIDIDFYWGEHCCS